MVTPKKKSPHTKGTKVTTALIKWRSPNYLDFDEYLRLPGTLRDDPSRVSRMTTEGLRMLLLPIGGFR